MESFTNKLIEFRFVFSCILINCPFVFQSHHNNFFYSSHQNNSNTFQNFLNGGNANMSFAIENVKQNRMPFIIAQILCEVKKNHQFCVPKTNL